MSKADRFKIFVAEAPCNLSGAFGNGYAVVPNDSPLFGKHYTDSLFDKIEVNGGLTYSNNENSRLGVGGKGWVLGFDTQHSHDTYALWPDEKSVLRECERLRRQLIELERIVTKSERAAA